MSFRALLSIYQRLNCYRDFHEVSKGVLYKNFSSKHKLFKNRPSDRHILLKGRNETIPLISIFLRRSEWNLTNNMAMWCLSAYTSFVKISAVKAILSLRAKFKSAHIFDNFRSIWTTASKDDFQAMSLSSLEFRENLWVKSVLDLGA